MTDPEARRWLQKHEACPIAWFEHDGGYLRCNDHDSDSPALAADLAPAAVGRAVLRLADSIAWTLRGGPDGSNTEAWNTQTGAVGSGDTITAAIEEALRDD